VAEKSAFEKLAPLTPLNDGAQLRQEEPAAKLGVNPNSEYTLVVTKFSVLITSRTVHACVAEKYVYVAVLDTPLRMTPLDAITEPLPLAAEHELPVRSRQVTVFAEVAVTLNATDW
jgi:hypothetical protein